MANPGIPLKTFQSSTSSSTTATDASESSKTRLLSNSSSRGLKLIDEEDEAGIEEENQKILDEPQHYGSIRDMVDHFIQVSDEIFSFNNCTKSKIIDLIITLLCLAVVILILVYCAVMTRAPDEFKFDNQTIEEAKLLPNDEFKQLKREVIRLCGTVEHYAAQKRDIICTDGNKEDCQSLSQLFLQKLHQCQIETDQRTQQYDLLYPSYKTNIYIGRIITIVIAILICILCVAVFITHGKTDIFRRPSKRIYNLPTNKAERGFFVIIMSAAAIVTIILFLAVSMYIPKECYSMSLETCKNQFPGFHG
jgi:hypothetical protein